MFVAKTKKNEQVSLIPPISPTWLNQYSPPYFCLVCNQEVILKKGATRRWHFAHLPHTDCPASHGGESEIHREAKIALYHWLRKRNIPVEMEKYFPAIQRQADLFVRWQSKKYVIEYQQSSLSYTDILKRTSDYLSLEMEPIWIYGDNRLRPKGHARFSLQSFEWIGLRERKDDGRHALTYFSPTTNSFSFLYPRATVQSSTIFADYYILPLSTATFSQIVHLPKTKDGPMNWKKEWLSYKWDWRYQRIHWQPHSDLTNLKQLLLNYKADLSLYPSEAGWPLLFGEIFSSPVYLWQTVFLLQVLGDIPLYEPFSFSTLVHSFLAHVHPHTLKVRELPFISKPVEKCLYSYVELLTQIGILKKQHKGWIKIKPIVFPRSIDEGFKMDKTLGKRIF